MSRLRTYAPMKPRSEKVRVCEVCGKDYRTRHWYKQRFCSPKCWQVLRGRLARKPCPVCGKLRLVSQLKKYCSVPCWRSQQRDATTLHCEQCGKAFRRYNGHRKTKYGVFCSQGCWIIFSRGKQSPAWRGGRVEGRGNGWQKRAEDIRRRDGYTCQRCGRTQAENHRKLCVDHIIPWRVFSDSEKNLANAETNLTSLCTRCHSQKTMRAERRWLRGDRFDFMAYLRALKISKGLTA